MTQGTISLLSLDIIHLGHEKCGLQEHMIIRSYLQCSFSRKIVASRNHLNIFQCTEAALFFSSCLPHHTLVFHPLHHRDFPTQQHTPLHDAHELHYKFLGVRQYVLHRFQISTDMPQPCSPHQLKSTSMSSADNFHPM